VRGAPGRAWLKPQGTAGATVVMDSRGGRLAGWGRRAAGAAALSGGALVGGAWCLETGVGTWAADGVVDSWRTGWESKVTVK